QWQRPDDERAEQPSLVPARGAVLQVVAHELDVVLAVAGHRRRRDEPVQCAEPQRDQRQRTDGRHSAEGYPRPTTPSVPAGTSGVLTGAAQGDGSIVEAVAAILRIGRGGRSRTLTYCA